MAEIVKMPKLSDTMTEGVVAEWHKNVGDQVESGDLLAEIETDKATMEFESFQEGVLLYIGVDKGKTAPVDSVLAILGEEGEDYKPLLEGAESASKEDSNESAPEKTESKEGASNKEAPKSDDKLADLKKAAEGIKAEVVKMPKLSDTMTDGVVAQWHKNVGDKVESGELLAEIETDKATMEFESFQEGTLLYRGVEEGQSAPVDSILAILGEEGADIQPIIDLYKAEAAAEESSEEKEEAPKPEAKQETNSAAPAPAPKVEKTASKPAAAPQVATGKVLASPIARKIAEERGLPLHRIPGSGDHGRIIKRDVENFLPGNVVDAQESFEDQPVSQMRKAIAHKVGESKYTAPHFYVTMDIDMDNAMNARKAIIEDGGQKVSFNDMVIKATAKALKKHPSINSSWLGDVIRVNHHVNVAVAMAVGDALFMPVVRFADQLSMQEISETVKEYAGRAKERKLTPEDWTGSTFTISNLGMFGVESFTGIINPPDACIMAVGGIKQVPVVKNGQVVPGNVMNVTLSCDHRVVDGAMGAAFLQTFKNIMENPVLMF